MPGRLVGVGFAVNNNPRLELKYVPFQHVYAEGTDDLSCFMLTYFFPFQKRAWSKTFRGAEVSKILNRRKGTYILILKPFTKRFVKVKPEHMIDGSHH